jgi:hypothetical protein
MRVGGCWHQCQCLCHDESSKLKMQHTAPCCDGKCDVCGRFIIRGLMARHKKECHGIAEAKK